MLNRTAKSADCLACSKMHSRYAGRPQLRTGGISRTHAPARQFRAPAEQTSWLTSTVKETINRSRGRNMAARARRAILADRRTTPGRVRRDILEAVRHMRGAKQYVAWAYLCRLVRAVPAATKYNSSRGCGNLRSRWWPVRRTAPQDRRQQTPLRCSRQGEGSGQRQAAACGSIIHLSCQALSWSQI